MKHEYGNDVAGAGNAKDELSAFEQFSLDFQSGLTGVLYILCKEVQSNPVFVIIGMVLDFLQLAAFPFNNRIPFPWNTETIGWFQTIANYARISALPVIVQRCPVLDFPAACFYPLHCLQLTHSVPFNARVSL